MLTCVCASVTGAILGKQGADWPRSSLRMGHSLPSACPVTLSQLPQLGLFLQMVMLLAPALPLEASPPAQLGPAGRSQHWSLSSLFLKEERQPHQVPTVCSVSLKVHLPPRQTSTRTSHSGDRWAKAATLTQHAQRRHLSSQLARLGRVPRDAGSSWLHGRAWGPSTPPHMPGRVAGCWCPQLFLALHGPGSCASKVTLLSLREK